MSINTAQRVTQQTLSSNVGRNLQRNMATMGRLQEQLSSGKLISKPSDNPTGTVSALRLRSEIRRAEQYQRNADDGIGWLGTADNALTDTLKTVTSARGLLLQGASAATDSQARSALAAELRGLREHALTLANTTYLDQPIFAGTADVPKAYDTTGAFQGNAGTISRTVGDGVNVQVNVAAEAVFGPAGNDLFKVLDDIALHLVTDPAALTASDLGKLDEAFLRLQTNLSSVGARYHQVEAMGERANSIKLDSSNQLANVESIDLPETVMQLKLQEVAYQAALGAAARVLQPSLVDFLR